MKMLFWSALIIAAIWWLMKKNLGVKNDLTAHLNEQKALQSIGNSALSASQIGQGTWPLTTIGDTSLAGIRIDPLDPENPFTTPKIPDFWQASPTPKYSLADFSTLGGILN